MSMLVTRRERFSAGHRLYNPAFSEAENARIFGKCSNPTGHGHNYVLEVTVEGSLEPATGYVIDLSKLSELIRERIIDDVDHRNLNEDVDWLQGQNPTTEVLASAFWDRLEAHLPSGRLHSLRLGETDKNWAERRRDGN
jgi:6-pyruvoyltetrahydropterin/6-carboxytetrahydropterin synthase